MGGCGPKGSRTRCRAPVRVGPFRFPPDLVRHWEDGEWVPGPGRVMRVTDAPGPPGPGDVSRVRGPSRWLDATVPCAIAADPSLARFVDWDVLARSIPTRPKQFVGAKWDELWAAWYDLAVTGATGSPLAPWRDRWLQVLQDLTVVGLGCRRRVADGRWLLTGSIALTIPDNHFHVDLTAFQASPPDRVIVSGGSHTLELDHHVVGSAGSVEFTDLEALRVQIISVRPMELRFANCSLARLTIFAFPDAGHTVPLALQLRNCRLDKIELWGVYVSGLVFDSETLQKLESLVFERCVLDVVPPELQKFVNDSRRVHGVWPDQQPGRPVPVTMEVTARR